MPSKRHGAQTRKQWLRMRLVLARDKTGAYDVERLLRRVCMTTLLQEVERGPICYTDAGLKRIAEAMNKATQGMNLQAHADRAFEYFLTVQPSTPEDRAQRKSPPITLQIRHVDCDCTSCRPWTT